MDYCSSCRKLALETQRFANFHGQPMGFNEVSDGLQHSKTIFFAVRYKMGQIRGWQVCMSKIATRQTSSYQRRGGLEINQLAKKKTVLQRNCHFFYRRTKRSTKQ